jgi:hypothetical protein
MYTYVFAKLCQYGGVDVEPTKIQRLVCGVEVGRACAAPERSLNGTELSLVKSEGKAERRAIVCVNRNQCVERLKDCRRRSYGRAC